MHTAEIHRVLLSVPPGRLVSCRVVRDHFGNAADPTSPATVGETVHYSPLRAAEFSQHGWVEVQHKSGNVITVKDPDYVAPVVATARVEFLRSGTQYSKVDGTLAISVAGEQDVIRDEHVSTLAMEPNPVVRRVA